MTRPRVIALIALLVVLLIVADASLFTVDQTEQVLITQFGDPVRVITAAGPAREEAVRADRHSVRQALARRRVCPGEEVILGDQRRLIVDSFVVFRIKDPLKYYQAVGTGDFAIQGRLNSIVTGSLRRVLGNNQLLDVLSADRDRIMATIRDQVNAEMPGLRRLDRGRAHPPRRPAAGEHPGDPVAHAVGAAARSPPRPARKAPRHRRRSAPTPNASAPCCWPRPAPPPTACAAKARPARPRIYAKAFSQDPWFFGVWRTLQGYRDAFATGAARLVITPDNAYLRYLQAPRPRQPVSRDPCRPRRPVTLPAASPSARCVAVRQLGRAICGLSARNPDHAPASAPPPPAPPCSALPPCSPRRSRRACRSRRPMPRGAPDSFADLAAKLLPAVVNVSSSQLVTAHNGGPGGWRRAGYADVPAGLAVRAILQGLPQPQSPGRPEARAATSRRRSGGCRASGPASSSIRPG